MGRKNGNTLVEMLFSIFICFMILNTLLSFFYGFNHLNLNFNNDLSYALYALTEEISMASEVMVYDDSLIIKDEQGEDRFYLHNQRLVKEPGFNIYLHHIDDISFYNDDDYVYMTLMRGEQIETFKIGIYFRPSYRICESDCVNNTSNNNEFDFQS